MDNSKQIYQQKTLKIVIKETIKELFPTRRDIIIAIGCTIVTFIFLMSLIKAGYTFCLKLEEIRNAEFHAAVRPDVQQDEQPLETVSEEPAMTEELETEIIAHDDVATQYVVMPSLDGGTISVDKELIDCIVISAKEHHVPVRIALSICYVESRFDPSANNEGTNDDGTTDWGIMQLNDSYFDYYQYTYNYGVEFDPLKYSDNIRIGMGILSDLCSYWDCSVYDVAASYNMGISGWEDYVTSYGWQWDYADQVLEYYYTLESYGF